MARVLPGASYYAILSVLGTKVERLNKETLRFYLEQHLRDLEVRIHALSQQSCAGGWQEWRSAPWDQEIASEEIWEGLLELDYLESVWEAVAETLASL
jgi:hypothetical protein